MDTRHEHAERAVVRGRVLRRVNELKEAVELQGQKDQAAAGQDREAGRGGRGRLTRGRPGRDTGTIASTGRTGAE